MTEHTRGTITESRYHKHLVALRYFLIGRNYFSASEAIELALEHHTGYRKDGITPEFFHQVSIAGFLRTLPLPEKDLETLMTGAILHDVVEDYDVHIDEIRERFGEDVALIVGLVTNSMENIKLPKELYYGRIVNDPRAVILKAGDRMHNIQTMGGVFTNDKQLEYIKETTDFIIPMLKEARRRYPRYEAAFENLKRILSIQVELIRETLLQATS